MYCFVCVKCSSVRPSACLFVHKQVRSVTLESLEMFQRHLAQMLTTSRPYTNRMFLMAPFKVNVTFRGQMSNDKDTWVYIALHCGALVLKCFGLDSFSFNSVNALLKTKLSMKRN